MTRPRKATKSPTYNIHTVPWGDGVCMADTLAPVWVAAHDTEGSLVAPHREDAVRNRAMP